MCRHWIYKQSKSGVERRGLSLAGDRDLYSTRHKPERDHLGSEETEKRPVLRMECEAL